MTTNYHFIKVAAAVPNLRVGDCSFNISAIAEMIADASAKQVQVVCFPELSITGYTCGDLFHQRLLITQAEAALAELLTITSSIPTVFIVGVPVQVCGKLYDCAIVCCESQLIGIVPKTYLANHHEACESRWFMPADDTMPSEIVYAGVPVEFSAQLVFQAGDFSFGVEIGHDLWAPIPPSTYMALAGVDIMFNLSASNDLAGKHDYLRSLIAQQSARCMAGYVYASCGWGESTTDLVFGGNGFVYENGTLLAESERFRSDAQLIINDIDIDRLRADRQTENSFVPVSPCMEVKFEFPQTDSLRLSRKISRTPFVPSAAQYNDRCAEVFSIQVCGLAKRLLHTGVKSAVLGVSGGLDSALALLVCVKAYDQLGWPRSAIAGITMPGFGTTGLTFDNAIALMTVFETSIRKIDITKACMQHFADIGHDPDLHDVTYENAQARERTQILMDVANQIEGLVVGTGDLSELALGWATYNGDHISMYGVNASIPKTLVRSLVSWYADTQGSESERSILREILKTPVSPELLPAIGGKISQRTEEVIGPYELHDFFLYYMIRFGFAPDKIFFLARHAFADSYTDAEIRRWMTVFYRRFFAQQFKRSCMPDGPKVGSVNLSPRGNWRMPSDASAQLWLRAIDAL